MARLVSLHHSLSEAELGHLRDDTMPSPGVAYLTSTDQRFLFRLAGTELLSDLDSAASAVSRLSARCNAEQLLAFPRTYAEVKSGCASKVFIQTFVTKRVDRQMKQMEKWIAVVVNLFEEMEVLAGMEAEEKCLFFKSFGPVRSRRAKVFDGEMLREELKAQRRLVGRLRGESLWSKSFDEAVELMSQSVLAIFAKICSVFGQFVPGLPPILTSGGRMSFTPINNKIRVFPMVAGEHQVSGPLETDTSNEIKEVCIRNSCPIIGRTSEETGLELPENKKKALKPAAASTVGGSGMEMQYASAVVLAEKLMLIRSGEMEAGEEEEAGLRDGIYRLLPVSIKAEVRRRLRERWMKKGNTDGRLAAGWKEAVESILRWLGPVARATVKWHEERTLDRRRRLCTKPRVLALQTLIFSERVKTEVAIVEVLVGLSCNCWYDGRNSKTT